MKWVTRFLVDGAQEGYLRFRVTIDGETASFGVPFVVAKKNWSRDTQRVTPNSVNGKGRIKGARINAELQTMENAAHAILANYEYLGTPATIEDFRRDFLRAMGKESHDDEDGVKLTVAQLYNRFLINRAQEKSWSKNTLQNHKVAMHSLLAYNDKLMPRDLTEATIVEWWLQMQSDDIQNETAHKYIINVKAFMKWCVKNGYPVPKDGLEYTPEMKIVDKPIIFLSRDELRAFEMCDLGRDTSLARIRDVFVFCCYSGLRYSDVKKLKKVHIHDGAIRVTTQKTITPIQIELNDHSLRILERYAGSKSEMALPVMSNQEMNRGVHKIAEELGISTEIPITFYIGATRHDVVKKKWELVTTHCARRTFISYAIGLGIPPNVIMKWTGHSDYEEMVRYIDIEGKLAREYMDYFNDKKSDKSSECK